ncbi:MAG TPA: ABC transporter substrate-binding protein [Anaerolineales bacterium]|nr:ABC transporter substrate-binding protein [Anaerolineales bacterium]
MHAQRKIRITIILMSLFAVLLGACGQTSSPEAQPPQTEAPPAEPVTLKIAVLPIMDNLPMYVADQEGLFEAHNVRVEFIPVSSAAERDQVIASGQADGMINEVVSAHLYNREQIQIQIVRFSRTATSTAPQYYILASGDSGITTPDGLKGVEIGISQGTVIEYITDRLLQAEGLASSDIKTIAVPSIADRMALLSAGELKAATLPDPLSFLAVQQGAVVVLDDSKHPEYGYSTLSFRKAFIDENPEALRAFLAAVEEATDLINSDPTQWDSLLVERQLVPQPLMGTYKVPPYPEASVPSQEQWDDVQAWMKDKGLLDTDVSYTDSVNASFLP